MSLDRGPQRYEAGDDTKVTPELLPNRSELWRAAGYAAAACVAFC
jgi:hypothetical protein